MPAIRLSSAGIHFFDRSSGVNILVDEVSIPSNRWSPAPRFVSIALTNVCDLRCSFCYAPKNRASLSASTVMSWIDELQQGGCLGIGFGGGEPTIHPHLHHLCKYAARRSQMAVTFTTHGHRVTPLLARELRGFVNFVRVSMDGIDDTYERIRGRSFEVLK